MAIGRNTCLHGEDCPACAKDRAIAERAEGDGQLVMLEWSVAQDDDLTGSDSEGGAVLYSRARKRKFNRLESSESTSVGVLQWFR